MTARPVRVGTGAAEPRESDEGRGAGSSACTGELIDRWRSGDPSALDRLVARHNPMLLARAEAHPLRRRLAARPDAGDVAHDALVRVLASGLLARFEDRGAGSLRKVLFRVLDRTLLDALRRERTSKRSANVARAFRDGTDAGLEAFLQSVDHREPSPTSQARTREWVETCRDLLAEREWVVWHAVEVGGRTAADVARDLGIAESAARGLLFRARRRILHELIARGE